jgi:hypothetical protein
MVSGTPSKNRASPTKFCKMRPRAPYALEALEGAAAFGIIGDGARIAKCALKAKAQIIYTCNTKHFSRIAEQVAPRVRLSAKSGRALLTRSHKLNS